MSFFLKTGKMFPHISHFGHTMELTSCYVPVSMVMLFSMKQQRRVTNISQSRFKQLPA